MNPEGYWIMLNESETSHARAQFIFKLMYMLFCVQIQILTGTGYVW